jgi:hypothetical protein
MASVNEQPSRSAKSGADGDVESDHIYDLVSVLYHALQGAETAATYIADAEAHGDEELASFFQEIHDAEKERADKAGELLAPRLSAQAKNASQRAESSDELENAAE